MNPFVIIFRQPSGQLGQADLEARSKQMPAWVQAVHRAGHRLDPRILAPESLWSAPDGREGAGPATGDGPLTALLFIEARDSGHALEIARSHPAFAHGASVEVRAWSAPPAQQ